MAMLLPAADIRPRPRGGIRARALRNIRPRHQRAQGRPDAGRAHGPRAEKKHAAEPQVWPNNARPSLRNGFNGLYVISPGTGSLAPVARNDHCRLDLSSGRAGPHDFTVRSMSFVRKAKAPLRHAASTAFRSTSVTIAIRPSGGTERRDNNADLTN